MKLEDGGEEEAAIFPTIDSSVYSGAGEASSNDALVHLREREVSKMEAVELWGGQEVHSVGAAVKTVLSALAVVVGLLCCLQLELEPFVIQCYSR